MDLGLEGIVKFDGVVCLRFYPMDLPKQRPVRNAEVILERVRGMGGVQSEPEAAPS